MRIRNIDPEASAGREHTRLGLPPLEENIAQPESHPVVSVAAWFMALVLLSVITYLVWRTFVLYEADASLDQLASILGGETFWTAVLVGFLAQVIDGALGMAYGITATTFLLASGASPAVASASVHIAEIFTTGLSGMAHARLGNVDRSLFLRLLLPGMLGAVLGAVVITRLDGEMLKPWVAGYLAIMGVYVLYKALRGPLARHLAGRPRHVGKLALLGGFVDAAGGGGWGPVVTSSLLGSGHDPRTTIGSVNFAEFFLTLVSGASFALLIGAGPWPIVAGLVFGGMFAAPLAAFLCRRLPAVTLMCIVGVLVTGLSLFTLVHTLVD